MFIFTRKYHEMCVLVMKDILFAFNPKEIH